MKTKIVHTPPLLMSPVCLTFILTLFIFSETWSRFILAIWDCIPGTKQHVRTLKSCITNGLVPNQVFFRLGRCRKRGTFYIQVATHPENKLSPDYDVFVAPRPDFKRIREDPGFGARKARNVTNRQIQSRRGPAQGRRKGEPVAVSL